MLSPSLKDWLCQVFLSSLGSLLNCVFFQEPVSFSFCFFVLLVVRSSTLWDWSNVREHTYLVGWQWPTLRWHTSKLQRHILGGDRILPFVGRNWPLGKEVETCLWSDAETHTIGCKNRPTFVGETETYLWRKMKTYLLRGQGPTFLRWWNGEGLGGQGPAFEGGGSNLLFGGM